VLGDLYAKAPVRAYGGITGHSIEAQFPAGLCLAALALRAGAIVPAFDRNHEAAAAQPSDNILVTTVGHQRGEGMALLIREK